MRLLDANGHETDAVVTRDCDSWTTESCGGDKASVGELSDAPSLAQAITSLADPTLLRTATLETEVLSPLRYPGGKRRLAPFIAAVLQENGRRPDLTVEPFAGGASVSLYLLQHDLTDSIGLADTDPLVAAFWETVFFDTEWLINEIANVPVTLQQWTKFKSEPLKDRRSRAVACLFLNRTSFSGILAPSAGPLGGRAQTSKYKIGCRFSRKTLERRIRLIGQYRDRVAFVHEASWEDTLAAVRGIHEIDGWDVFTYLDPPFFHKADRLYRYFFEAQEHVTLRDEVVTLPGDWLISYDSVPSVVELYINQQRIELGAIYTASTAGGYRQVNEAVVSSLQLPVGAESRQLSDKSNSGKEVNRA